MLKDPFLLHHKHAAELYLIRHGDAIPGPDEIIPSGIYDDLPLSRDGREQAQKLAERLKTTHFDAAYSSPLRRCLETAEPLLTRLELTPIVINDLKEIRAADLVPIPRLTKDDDLEALTRALQARQMEIVRLAGNSGSWDDASPDETSKAFRQRVIQAFDKIVADHIGQRVLVFCHGGVINAYVAEVLGLEKEFFFPCANTSINVVRANAEARVLFVLNDIAHIFS